MFLTPGGYSPSGGEPAAQEGGRKKRGVTAKQLKRVLKKAGLKTTGRKAALSRRVKKAHLKMMGGDMDDKVCADGSKPMTQEELDAASSASSASDSKTAGKRRSRGKKTMVKLY